MTGKISYEGHNHFLHPEAGQKDGWYTYVCGHCQTKVTGAVAAQFGIAGHEPIRWLQCTSCGNGSVLTAQGSVHPAVLFGPQIEGLPEDVESAYDEARRCMSVGAYTACELMCRKILMHVGVEKDAKEGESFAYYLSYLEDNNFITRHMKVWTNLIKEHGNKSTHRLESPDKTRSESTLMFTAELLRLVYEMTHLAKKYLPEMEP